MSYKVGINIIPITYYKIFYRIINDEVIYAYIISLVLKRDYNIIKENFVYTNKVLFNEYMVKITITRHINLKK